MWFIKRRFKKRIKKRFKPFHPSNRKPVMLFSEDGYIKTYPSIQSASEATGIGENAIWSCATGRNKKTQTRLYSNSIFCPETEGYRWVTWEYK